MAAALVCNGTLAIAQETGLQRMPDPDVAEVRSFGYWEGDDGFGGDIRLVTIDAGLDKPVFSTQIVWSRRDFDTRRFENVAVAPLPTCGAASLGQADVVAAIQPDIDGPVLLTLRPLSPDGTSKPNPLVYEIGGPGEITLAEGCQ